MHIEEQRSIVFYDGQCGFCNDTVQLILRRDSNKIFHFSSLQSGFANEFMQKKGISSVNLDTMYVYHEGELYNRSKAVAIIGKHLKGQHFKIISKIISKIIQACPSRAALDFVYDIIAKNRYLISNKKQGCSIPNKQNRKRFID